MSPQVACMVRSPGGNTQAEERSHDEEATMPNKRASVKNEKQYEGLRKEGMSKERAAKIANSPGASSRGGKKSGSKKKSS